MTKQIILSHVTVSQSPAVIAKIKNLENIVTKLKAKTSHNTKNNIVQTPTYKSKRIILETRTNHADKDNSKNKDVSSILINYATHENEESNLHFHCLDDILDYYITKIRTEEHPRDSNHFPRTLSYPVMLTSRDAKFLDSNICTKYPTTLSHIRASKARPCHIYLKNLNIRLMKPQ